MVFSRDYYIIMFLNDLTYHILGGGVPNTDIIKAAKYETLELAQKELETLDDDYKEVAAIYSVHECRTYDLDRIDN